MIIATKKDIPAIVKILAPAFSDNLSVNRCVKQDSNRLKRIENQIKYISRICIRNNMAFINNEKTSAVLCHLTSGKKATIMDDLYYLFCVSGVRLGLQLMKREKLLKQIVPEAEGCHLWFIGVDKNCQGKGLGSAAMGDIKQMCKEKNLPIYLETSNPRNLKFYEKNGFELYYKIQLPTDDFELYFFRWRS